MELAQIFMYVKFLETYHAILYSNINHKQSVLNNILERTTFNIITLIACRQFGNKCIVHAISISLFTSSYIEL